MHELSIAQSIVDSVLDRLPDRRILVVRVEIGPLSGVVADSVLFCFDLVTEGTPAAGARLDISTPTGSARCRDCAREFTVDDVILLCPDCGSADAEVLSGDQLRITSVEVTKSCAEPAAAPTKTTPATTTATMPTT